MAKPVWIEPTLDGGAVRAAAIRIWFVYGVGWKGVCEIQQEGRWANPLLEVSRLDEGTTEDLETWLRLVTRFIGGY